MRPVFDTAALTYKQAYGTFFSVLAMFLKARRMPLPLPVMRAANLCMGLVTLQVWAAMKHLSSLRFACI